MTYSLFLDDERNPCDCFWAPWIGVITDWVVVRTPYQFLMAMENYGLPSYVSFDHDLNHNLCEYGTGKDCAEYLVNFDMNHNYKWNGKFYIHSKNPVGKENIEKYLLNYLTQRG